MVSQVRFSHALKSLCLDAKAVVDILVEIGPHSALAGFVSHITTALEPGEKNTKYMPSLVRPKNAVQTMMDLASSLFVAGYPIDLDVLNSQNDHSGLQVLSDLPQYPWNHSTSYWHE